MLACGEREAMVLAAFLMRDSAVSPYFHGCLAFLHWHFPPLSPPLHPLNPSLCNQQQPPPWDHSTIRKLPVPLQVCMAAARTVWSSFHLGCHRAAVSLSALNVSPLTQTIAPMCGSDPCFSSPTRWGQIQWYQHSCPHPHPPWVPSFHRALQGSIYSIPGPAVHCQLVFCKHFYIWGVFLMYPWREMYSTSTYSSTILFSVSKYLREKNFIWVGLLNKSVFQVSNVHTMEYYSGIRRNEI